eukprot:TRINITY_DN6359_c0_g3_i1.p1 TRINITY_DN6359_c0_g3~~TRINITY_DN6359_c0_g3_i1.p1  ORF type:complete len:390 (+),score=66.96 TRINITY_DN6359_c0_g3_i1:52-1221(+)
MASLQLSKIVVSCLLGAWCANAKSVRDAILCQAVERLGSFEAGTRSISDKKEKDGINIFFSGTASCGGADVPILFANWSLAGVRPVHVFAAIADVQGQRWTGDLAHTLDLSRDMPFSARGMMIQYSVGTFISDRKVHEWETYSNSPDGNEYWFAASTQHNGLLQQMDTSEDNNGFFFGFRKPVEIDSCLSAHHFVATKDGVRGTFTTNINSHAPMHLSESLVSQMTWGKSAELLSKLKTRALQLAQIDQAALWKPSPQFVAPFPPHGPTDAGAGSCAAAWADAEGEINVAREAIGLAEVQDDAPPMMLPSVPASQALIPVAFAMGFLTLAIVLGRRRRSARASQASTMILQVDDQEALDPSSWAQQEVDGVQDSDALMATPQLASLDIA